MSTDYLCVFANCGLMSAKNASSLNGIEPKVYIFILPFNVLFLVTPEMVCFHKKPFCSRPKCFL